MDENNKNISQNPDIEPNQDSIQRVFILPIDNPTTAGIESVIYIPITHEDVVYYMAFSQEIFEYVDKESNNIIPLDGIRIFIEKSINNIKQKTQTAIPYFHVKELLEKAIRFLALGFQTVYNDISTANKEIIEDPHFKDLKSAIIRFFGDDYTKFVYYYNPSLRQGDAIALQKILPTIFDDPEKANFILTGTEKINTTNDLKDTILLYNKSYFSLPMLKELKDYITLQTHPTASNKNKTETPPPSKLNYSQYKQFANKET